MLTCCMERSRAKSLPAQPPPPGPSAATREIPGIQAAKAANDGVKNEDIPDIPYESL